MNDEHATEQNQPARQTPGETAQQAVSLDDYFDQLDAAFSNLQQPGSAAAQHDTMRAEEDWIDSQPEICRAPDRVNRRRPDRHTVNLALAPEPRVTPAPPRTAGIDRSCATEAQPRLL